MKAHKTRTAARIILLVGGVVVVVVVRKGLDEGRKPGVGCLQHVVGEAGNARYGPRRPRQRVGLRLSCAVLRGMDEERKCMNGIICKIWRASLVRCCKR